MDNEREEPINIILEIQDAYQGQTSDDNKEEDSGKES